MTEEDVVFVSHEPQDRLTHLCASMTTILNEPENADVKCIVFLHDEQNGGIQTHGYEDSMEAMTELFIHMRAIFKANGTDLSFVGFDEDGAMRI